MWLYCTGSDASTQSDIPNIVLYEYQSGRTGQCAVDYLAGYSGYLQVDGYVGYEKTAATLAGNIHKKDILSQSIALTLEQTPQKREKVNVLDLVSNNNTYSSRYEALQTAPNYVENNK